jgi:hypothetical protein
MLHIRKGNRRDAFLSCGVYAKYTQKRKIAGISLLKENDGYTECVLRCAEGIKLIHKISKTVFKQLTESVSRSSDSDV